MTTDHVFNALDPFDGAGTTPVKAGALAAITVTEYAARIERAVNRVGGALLAGEVLKVNPWNGMLFFSVTDGDATLSCMVFRSDVRRLQHPPREGDMVQLVVDRPQFRKDRGSLTLIISQITLAGEGELLRRRQELLDRLTAEGLCRRDRLRPLPTYPRAVGVIAGQGSDAMSDVTRALQDRWPATHIVTVSATVTGARAPGAIIDAIVRLQAHPRVDVVIVARGGGSVRDLACFDDERLCRALAACATPVITAIGHTDNVPVCNHVAWPATTPSRSAEMAVPSARDAGSAILNAAIAIDAVPARLDRSAERVRTTRLEISPRLDLLRERIVLRAGPATVIATRRVQVTDQSRAATGVVDTFVQEHALAIRDRRPALDAVPRRAAAVLTEQHDDVVRNAADLQAVVGHVDRLRRDIPDLGERVHAGIHRQLKDHARDYARAAARLTAEARTGLNRSAARLRREIAVQSRLLDDRVNGRFADARRDLRHAAEVIAARDFRRAGWVLVGLNGHPVRSAADLQTGANLTLDFHDGRASATIDHTNTKEQHS